MLIVSDSTDRALQAFGVAVPSFSYFEPSFYEEMVKQLEVQKYSQVRFGIPWVTLDKSEIHKEADRVWKFKKPWFCYL